MTTARRIPRTSEIAPVASVLVVLCYLTFTTLAILNYPLPYSPVSNWLSDLGNTQSSPSGSQFYNLGIIVTALFVLAFYLTISQWRLGKNKVQNIMVLLTQLFGVAASFAMVLTALNPINMPAAHSLWSAALRVSFGTSFAFSVAALRYRPQTPRWLLAMGVVVAATNLVVSMFFNGVHILEWIVLPSFLVYMLALGWVTRLISEEATPTN
jgi:hypothetical membrane protein